MADSTFAEHVTNTNTRLASIKAVSFAQVIFETLETAIKTYPSSLDLSPEKYLISESQLVSECYFYRK